MIHHEDEIRTKLAQIESLAKEVKALVFDARTTFESRGGRWPVMHDFTIDDDWSWLCGSEDYIAPPEMFEDLVGKLKALAESASVMPERTS